MTDEAEKPSEEEQQEKKVRKVGTGAWWKSAADQEEAKEETPPEKKVPRKRAPRKKKIEAEAVPAPTEETAPTAVAVPQDKAQSFPQAEEEVLELVAESGPAAGEMMAVESAPSTQEAGNELPVKKKRPRRRGGKKNRTGEAPQPETAENPPAGAEIIQPAPEEVSVEQGQRKKRPDRKRSQKSRADEEDADEVQEEEPQESDSRESSIKVAAKLLINAEEPEECRIAIVENGRLEAFHVTTAVHERTKNNIYKGRIISIEANLQAAFVEIGTGRNGFLPFSDIHPEYYKEDISEQSRALIRQQQWRKLKIEDVVSRGQEVLVQVVKEVTGNKGANMTTFLSLPGRCLVLMPGSDSTGISRKISGEERRGELRQMMSGLSLPEGIGYIIRTASAEITQVALEEDLAHLLKLWSEIRQRGQTLSAPALVYEDQDTVVRFLRDHFTPEIKEIIVDTEEAYEQATRFVVSLPEQQRKVQVKLHRGAKPIFNQHSIEEQIESIYQPQVQLPSGGSIVINPTEALVAIDVNSGRTSQKGDFDQSIFLANVEAAEELSRQLRLRDLGGLIVVDFIDMRNSSHIKEVERRVKNAMKRDKAKVDISRISRFGLMQISRQKMGAPIEKGSYHICEYCAGRGVIRSVETLALYYLRRIQTGVSRKKVNRVEASLPLEVGQYLLNKKRLDINDLENRHQATIEIRLCPEMKPGDNKIEFLI
ncbi:Rne/Rng family ribonuclease [Candidatus Electronema sp. PJ]|uniref:Rne/Rng family ribonuclease n=1 Tax=Candidatus Electronema sp. PJ TaxID=3401572 RepID=UPI003AA86A62